MLLLWRKYYRYMNKQDNIKIVLDLGIYRLFRAVVGEQMCGVDVRPRILTARLFWKMIRAHQVCYSHTTLCQSRSSISHVVRHAVK